MGLKLEARSISWGEESMEEGYIFIGYIAAILTTFSGVPQIIRILKLKESRDISLWAASLLSTGILLWLIHGLMIWDVPLILSNSISFIFSTATLYVIIKYR